MDDDYGHHRTPSFAGEMAVEFHIQMVLKIRENRFFSNGSFSCAVSLASLCLLSDSPSQTISDIPQISVPKSPSEAVFEPDLQDI